MDPRLTPLHTQLELNHRLLVNCFAGVDEVTAARRGAGKTNSMIFLAAHLVEARHYLLGILGGEPGQPLPGLAEVTSLDELDPGELPSTAEVLARWEETPAPLAGRLAALGAAELDARCEPSFPVDPESVLGGAAFLLQHESYHVGQLALLRRQLGLPPMSYD